MAAEAPAGVEKTADSNTDKKMQIILVLPRPGSDTVASGNKGNTVALEVSSSDTVASLNARIANIRGIPLCRQRLVVKAQPWPLMLDPSKPDRPAVITEKKKMEIFVVLPRPSGLMDPNTIALEVSSADTVATLKARLENIDGDRRIIRPCQQRLVFAGTALPDDDSVTTLADLGVVDSSTVQLVETGMRLQINDYRLRHMYHVSSTDTVDALMARYEAMEGVPADRQRMSVYGQEGQGRVELEKGRTLADYGFRDGQLVDLRRLRWDQTAAYRALGRVLTMMVRGSDTVGDVKRTVEAKAGVPVAAQRAYDYSVEVDNLEDERTMEELGIMVNHGYMLGPPPLYIECRGQKGQGAGGGAAAEGRRLPCRPRKGDLNNYYSSRSKMFSDRAERMKKEAVRYWRPPEPMARRIIHVFLEPPDPLLP